jgi:hypothetical protein
LLARRIVTPSHAFDRRFAMDRLLTIANTLSILHGHLRTTRLNSPTMNPDIRIYPDAQAIARAAAELIAESAGTAINAKGIFSLVLSGGSTPKLLYALLAQEPFRAQIAWKSVEIKYGDERNGPPDHAEC